MPRSKRAARGAVSIEAALKTVWISDVRVSPDGEIAAFVKSVVRKDEKTRGTSIWAVPVGGGKARQLTQGPEDAQPRWSPDGVNLAFTRKEAGADKAGDDSPAQIFLLPRDGGEPAKLTDPGTAPEALTFAPTGKHIAFLAQTPDDKTQKRRKEEGDDARVFVKDDKPKRLWTASARSGRAKAASPEDLALWEYDWLPDGRRAAAIYTDEPRLDALYFGAKIGIVDSREVGIEHLDVTFRFAARPRVSPDGRYIALVGGVVLPPNNRSRCYVSIGSTWTQ
jgi:dipeptidyl aminopeptidase/acylaminoacyl peptidase